MMRSTIQFLFGGDMVRWIAGPILDKELRVASRRRRSYVFRFAYLALLGAFVILVWMETVRPYGFSAYAAMQMSQAGLEIVTTLVWVQFVMVPLAAIVMLSTAISEEVYRRTLGVLMTTPITGFQIVIGKLASGLLQMVLLVAVSLPLLCVVRVFGGVPWEFVVSGLCLTMATALVAGSLSLWFSIGNRHAYWVVLETLVAMFVLFFMVPWLCVMVCDWSDNRFLDSAFGWCNPYVAMLIQTDQLTSARPLALAYSWQGTCLALVVASALLVAASVVRVRRVALGEIAGERRVRRRAARRATSEAAPAAVESVRRVRGSPVVWRELRTHLAPSRRHAVWGTVILLVVLAASYLSAGRHLPGSEFQMVTAFVLVLLGLLATAVVAATGITSEKEAGSWPILLATPLAREHILLGKAVGVLRRSLPVWMLLGLHLAISTAIGYIHVMVAVNLAILSLGAAVFLTGSGLLLGALVRRTTLAVVLNLGMGLVLWAGVPLLGALVAEAFGKGGLYGETALCANPMAQVVVVTEYVLPSPEGFWESARRLHFSWPRPIGGAGLGVTTFLILCTAAAHAYLGLALAALAGWRIRRAAR